MIRDYISIVLKNLAAKRLRTALTMIGIFIGIASVVALISVGQGMQRMIGEEFDRIGKNTVIITPGGGNAAIPGTSSAVITLDDVDRIKKISGITGATYVTFKSARVEYNDKVIYPFVFGIPTDGDSDIFYKMLADIELGRKLRPEDKYKAIVGYRIVRESSYFGKPVSIGDKIKIQNKDFTVVGSLEKVGNSQDDSQIYIPYETAKDLFSLNDEVLYIYAQGEPDINATALADAIKKDLRKVRGEKSGEESFDVQTAEQLIEIFNTVFSVVTWFLVGIAAISLLVGGVGIMNTMYTSILERTRDIGIMKAIGATKKDILGIFLIESGLLGLAGGIVGILIGMGLSQLIGIVASIGYGTDYLYPHFPLYLLFGTLAFSFLIGTIAGALPAVRAANLHPVDALQYRK